MERSTEKNYLFSPITENNIRAMGVQALATRPNATGGYGQGGLSATELKLWFDKLATTLAGRINELGAAINGEEAAKYIGLAVSEYKTLDELIEAMGDGGFAANVMKVYPAADKNVLADLQSVIYGIAESISDLYERKLDKQTPDVLSAYSVDENGDQGVVELSTIEKAGAIAQYNDSKQLRTANPTGHYHAMNLGYFNNHMAELAKHIGAGVKFTLDPNTYKLVVEVVNTYGQVIWRDESVDLPLEEMIVDVQYEDGKLKLILKNGNVTEVPVDNIVGGLASDEEVRRLVKGVDDKLNALFEEYIEDINELVGGDYADYS